MLGLCNIYLSLRYTQIRIRFTFVTLLTLFLCLETSFAATYTWDGGGNNSNWSTGNNWNPHGAPSPGGNATLIFSGTTRLSPIADNGPWSLNSLTFNSGAGAFTLSGDTINLANGLTQNSANAQTITNDIVLGGSQTWNIGGGGLALTGDLSDPWYMTLTKTGTGTLTLSGNNSGFTGPVVIAAGTINVQSSTALGSNTGNTIQSGGALELQGGITLTEDSFNLTGTGVNGNGALCNVSGNNTLNASLTLGGNTLIRNESGNFTLSGTFAAGSNTLTLSGAGNTNFTGAYQGNGTIYLNTSGNTTFASSFQASKLTLAGSGDTTFNNSAQVTTLTVSGSGNNIFAGELQATGAAYLNGTGVTTFSGSSGNNTPNVYVNSGTLILAKNSGTLAISGDLTVGDGTGTDIVQFNADNQTPSYKGITVNSSGVLNLNGHRDEITTLTLSGGTVSNTSSGLITINNAAAIVATTNSNTATVNSNILFNTWNMAVNVANGASAVDLAITGTLTASHGLSKTGTGTLQLSGTYVNSDGSALNVTGGTLLLGSSNVFASGTAANGTKTGITLAAGTTFASGGNSDTMGTLTLSGNSTIDLGNGASSLTFDNVSYSSGTVTISNWTNGSDHIYFSTNPTGTFLANVYWADSGTTGAIMIGGELRPINVPVVPELDTALSALLFLVSVALFHRRRTGAWRFRRLHP